MNEVVLICSLGVDDVFAHADAPQIHFKIIDPDKWIGSDGVTHYDKITAACIQSNGTKKVGETYYTEKDACVLLIEHASGGEPEFELDVNASPIGYSYTTKKFREMQIPEMDEWMNYGDSLGYELVRIYTLGALIIVTMRKAKATT